LSRLHTEAVFELVDQIARAPQATGQIGADLHHRSGGRQIEQRVERSDLGDFVGPQSEVRRQLGEHLMR
jgi:hypothetical protein